MQRFALPLFFTLAILLPWAVWWPPVAEHFGWGPPVTPYLHLLGSLGPAVAAFLVAARLGRGELLLLLRGIVRRRVGGRPWAFAVLGPVVLLGVGLLVARLFGQPWPSWRSVLQMKESPHLGPLALVAAEIVFYGYGEEIGWRGFALPRLMARYGPLWASVLVSVPWAVYHLPLLLRNETYSSMSPALLAGWYVSLLAGSFLTTWLYRLGQGSLLVLAVFHGLLDVVMVNEGASQLALTAMGALVTVWGIFAIGALRRDQERRNRKQATT